MTDQQEPDRTGRRALFTGTGSNTGKGETLPVSEIVEIIRQINTGERSSDLVPPIFAPVVNQIIELTRKTELCNKECKDLTTRLLTAEDIISGLKEDAKQVASERESYLNDLITSHTEFDRALEIFQYHERPMILTGKNNTVHDANDAFCSLFSIVRSEITTSHPPLQNYISGDHIVSAPDGTDYTLIALTPPVVPFDHEAESLIVLIKNTPMQETLSSFPDIAIKENSETINNHVSSKIVTEAFDQFPIPAAVINQYLTIVLCNQAFSSLVAREKEILNFRDIGSCGIAFDEITCFNDILDDLDPRQCSTVITRPDGSEIKTYIEILPVYQNLTEPSFLIIGVETADEEKPDQIKKGSQPSEFIFPDTFIHMLMDLNPSATALLDSHARILSANEGFCEINGLSPNDLIGTDVRDLGIFIPDSVLVPDATEAEYLPDIISTQSVWGAQKSSGMVVPIGTSGTKAVAILVLQPIEDSVSVHLQKEEAPVKLSAIRDLNSIPLPFLCTDFSGKIIEVNNTFLSMSAATSEQILGHMKNELISTGAEGYLILTVGTKTCMVQEIIGRSFEEDGNKEYWYLDISEEAGKNARLKARISLLENELSEVQVHQETARDSYLEKNSEQIDIVEFELNQERYAIDITMVREVVDMLPITPLPRTPPYVTGIINLRGEVTHIIDLAILLGERPKKERSGQKIIIIPSDVSRGEHVGIIVDNVQSVTEILGRHVSFLGENITSQINTHIKGIIKISHDDVLEKHAETSKAATLVIWLDIKKILNDIQGAL